MGSVVGTNVLGPWCSHSLRLAVKLGEARADRVWGLASLGASLQAAMYLCLGGGWLPGLPT